MDASDIAQRQLDAYNRGDVEAFAAVFDEACVVRAFPSGEVLLEGREALRERYGRQFEACPRLHARLLARVSHDAVVIDHEEVTGLDAERTVYAVAMYEIEGEHIRNVWFIRPRS